MDAKELGALGEMMFATEALRHGFSVCRPYCDRKFDLILEKNGRFHRIQIKTCKTLINDYYHFATSHGSGTREKYTRENIDIICCIIPALRCFYMIPINKIKVKSVRLYPNKPDSRFSEFMNNWDF